MRNKRTQREAFYYRHKERILSEKGERWKNLPQDERMAIAADIADQYRFNNHRRAVLARDRNACTECGATEQLVVHHLDPRGNTRRDTTSTMDDLITLCRACHLSEHRDDLNAGRS